MKKSLKPILGAILVIGLRLIFLNLLPATYGLEEASWEQTSWFGGSGQASWILDTKYASSENIDDTNDGQISLKLRQDWYNPAWTTRQKISFNNSSQTEALTNFPLLVKLDAGSDIDYTKTQDNGQDIRFTDSDGVTLLSHEIESWNESGSSYLWVKVPQIDAASTTDSIYMYYDNPTSVDGQSAVNVWSDNFTYVLHLKEDPSGVAPQILDSSLNALTGTTGGTMTSGDQLAGIINGSIDFDGSDDYINFGNPAAVYFNPPFTLSLWLNIPNLPTGDQEIISKYNPAPQRGFIWAISPNGLWAYKSHDGTTGEYFTGQIPINAEDVGVWRNVVISMSADGAYKLFKDGDLVTTGQITNSNWHRGTANLNVGRSSRGSYYFKGKLDEVTMATTARSEDYVAANFLSQSNQFNTYGSKEGVYYENGTLTSSVFDTNQPSNWGVLDYVGSGSGTIEIKVRTGNNPNLSDAEPFSNCVAIDSGSDISANSCVNDLDRFVQYQAVLESSPSTTTALESVRLNYSLADIIPPQVKDLTISVESQAANITWTTNESASTQVEYGLSNNFGYLTPLSDARVVNHSYRLEPLTICTTYFSRPRSVDSAGNEVIGDTLSFTTLGCAGSASVTNQTSSVINSSTGSKLDLLIGEGAGVSISVPPDYHSTDLIFQIKQLDSDSLIRALPSPKNYALVADFSFDFIALSDVNSPVKSFNSPVILTALYTDSQLTNFNPTTLQWFRWTGAYWEALSTSLDLTAKTATSQTDSFSVYSLFGQPLAISTPTITPLISQQSTVTKMDTEHETLTPESLAPTATMPVLKTLHIKLTDTNSRPIEGATLTLYSDFQKGLTNSQGELSFESVTAGSHRLVIDYRDYHDEKTIFIPEDSNEIYQLTLTIDPAPISKNILIYVILSLALVTGLLLLIRFLKKRAKFI